MLEFPDLDEDLRIRFSTVIRDEIKAMSERLDNTANEFAGALKARWPLEDMSGADLIAAVKRSVENKLKVPTKLEGVDEGLWVKVDSFSLVQALLFLVSRLSDDACRTNSRYAKSAFA